MNTSPILLYAKKLLATPQTKEEEQNKRQLVYDAFPKVVEELEIAEEALQDIVNVGLAQAEQYPETQWYTSHASKALTRIHSLTPPAV